MKRPELQVLLVEDNPADVLSIQDALAQDNGADFRLIVVESLSKALNILKTQTFAAVLLDLGLPDSQGMSTFLSVHQSTPDIPVVVLSALDDEDVATQALHAGAQDYLVKHQQDFLIAGRAIRYAVERQKSERQFYSIFHASPTPQVITCRATGKILDANEAQKRLLGFSREEMIGHTMLELGVWVKPGQREELYRILQAEGRVKGMEVNIQTHTGTSLTMVISMEPIELNGEQCVLSSALDITERKQAEQKLLESEVLLRQVLESTQDAIFAIDRNYRLLVNNRIHQELLVASGSHSFQIGENVLSSDFPSDMLDYWRCMYDRAFHGEPSLIQLEWTDIYHQPRAFVNRVSPLRDAEGIIIGALMVSHDVTEQKQTEVARDEIQASLQQERSLLRTLIDNLPDYIFMKDTQSRFLVANQATAELMGEKSPDQLIGKTDFEFYPKDIAKRYFDREQRIMQSGENIYNSENPQLDSAQNEHWLSTTKLALRDPQGRVIGLVGIERDIERIQAERNLRASEQRLRSLLQSESHFVMRIDMQGHYTYWNEKYKNEFGWLHSQQDLNKASPLEAVCEHHHALVYETVEKCISQPGQVLQVEIDKPSRDGGIRTSLWEWVCLTDENGQPWEIQCMGVEITDRKKAEAVIKKTNERFYQIADNINDIFWIFDPYTQKHEYANPAFEKIFGASVQVVDQQPNGYLDFVHPDDRQHLVELRKQEKSGFSTDYVYRIVRPDGQIRWLHDKAIPILDSQGIVHHIVGTSNDITAQREAETALRRNEVILRLLVEHTPASIAMFDREMRYIVTSRRYLEENRLGEQNLIGRSQYDVFPDTPAEWKEVHRRCLNGATEKKEEDIFVHPDGQVDWTRWEFRPWYEENGQIGGLLLFSEMITERKLAEEKLRESENRFATIFEESPVAIAITSFNDGKIIQVNSAFIKTHGFTREEIIGHTSLDLGIWENTDERQQFMDLIRSQGHVAGLETTTRIKSGEKRRVLLWGEQITITNEPCLMVQIVDITERKQAETLLNQRLEDLAFVNTLNDAVNHGDDITQITDLLTAQTKEIFGSKFAAVLLVQPETQTLVLQPYNLQQENIKNIENLLGRPIPQIEIPIGGNDHFSQVMKSDRGIIFTGTKAIQPWLADFINTRFLPAQVRPLIRKLIPAFVKLLNVSAVISIPLKAGDEVLGLIEFITEDKFDDSAINRLQNVRHQFSEVIIRKRTEQSLRESNEKYRLLSEELEERIRERTAEVQDLYNNAPTGYHSLDLHGNIIEINQTQLDWSGYPRDEMIGQPFGKLLTSESRVVFEREFSLFKKRGFVRDMEFEMLRKDGSTFHILVNAVAIYDEQGDYVMSRSTVFDNTQRKQAEQALRESEETYRSLFESANDAIFLLDINTRNYVRVNSRCPEFLGVNSTEDLIGRSAYDFIASSETELADKRLQTLLKGERIPPYERTFRRADGTYVKTEINLSLIRDNNGQPKLIQSVVRDITLRKQAEEVLRESEGQLRISRDKLSAANAALEKASRMKDEFLSSMSHELRTPLSGILGLSEALQFNTYGTLNEKQSKALRSIEESGRHLLDLINDILDLSKIEAGMLDLNIDLVSLADVCQASLHLTKGMAQKKKQSVRFLMEPSAIYLRGDARRIKQMLVNLLSNAIKFTPENGSLGLDVHTDKKNKVVRLTVWDKGIGIAPENLKILFQPFVQLESSLSRQYEGTGLGLSLVHRMAELQGGSIQVESMLGEGSQFTILLPWLPDITQPIQTTKKGSLLLIKKALILEDHETHAGKLTRYLQILGIDSAKHKTDQNIIELCEHEKPDVIFLDLHQPDHSGFNMLADLKESLIFRNVPVIFCSVEENRSQAISLGVAAYLTEPFTFSELQDEILKVASALEKNSVSIPASIPTQARVLIVDDNEVVIETISDFLESQNFRVVSVRSGHELIRMVADLYPDIILMDIQMPGMDGLEATRHIRTHPDPVVSQVPIIAVTALAMDGDRERCIAAGANEYLSKPIRLKQLVETIRYQLNGK